MSVLGDISKRSLSAMTAMYYLENPLTFSDKSAAWDPTQIEGAKRILKGTDWFKVTNNDRIVTGKGYLEVPMNPDSRPAPEVGGTVYCDAGYNQWSVWVPGDGPVKTTIWRRSKKGLVTGYDPNRQVCKIEPV